MRQRGTWVAVIVVALGVLSYFWIALRPPGRALTREPDSYYAYLAAGFQSGHLYASLAPHPALLALPDPYDPVANAPYRVHDMTFYHGKYYLYFGATPAVIFFWPVWLLTHWHATDAFAVAVFASAALALGAGLLVAMWRRYFPEASQVALTLAVACLAWASPVILLTQGAQFYQVPIVCAYFLQMVVLVALYRALHAREASRLWWMASASLAYGLAVGSRPNYILGGAAVLVVMFWLWRDTARTTGRVLSAAVAKLMLAALLPAAICAAALLWYNEARFGSPLEFGMRYQLAGEKFLALQPLALRNILPHLWDYLLGDAKWSPYFPFFAPRGTGLPGMFRYTPWLWLALAALWPAVRSRPGRGTGTLYIWAVLAAWAGNVVLLSAFFGMTERYAPDFMASFLVLAGVGAFALAGAAASRPAARKWLAACFVGLAFFSVALNGSLLVRRWPLSDGWLAFARLVSEPRYVWERLNHRQSGALRLDVVLPEHPPHFLEPLFQTGTEPDQRDWLQIEYLEGNQARLGFFHAGLGLLQGDVFNIPADRHLVIEAQCGSLLPPFSWPIFSGVSRATFDRTMRRLSVTVNGTERLRGTLECYPSSPKDLVIGGLAWPGSISSLQFAGQIRGVGREPLVLENVEAVTLHERRPVELKIRFPAGRRTGIEPILVTGEGSHSDLLYCIYAAEGQVRFALDHYGNGGPVSEAVAYDPLREHSLKVWMGSLAPASAPEGDALPWSHRLVVLLDDRVILNTEQIFYPATPEQTEVGVNTWHASTAEPQFTGQIDIARTLPFSAMPDFVQSGRYGAVAMTVVFPLQSLGSHDPIVVTGVTGAGDLIYVHYIDSRHLVFGFDHWGVGGFIGQPVELDYGQPHHLEITMGSLYGASPPAGWADRVRVRLDGRTVLSGNSPTHPSTAAQVRLLENPIGGSTCGPVFLGRTISIERPPAPIP